MKDTDFDSPQPSRSSRFGLMLFLLIVIAAAAAGYQWLTRPTAADLLASATAAMARHDFEAARRLATEAGERDPNLARAWLTAGAAAEALMDYDGAVRLYTRIASLARGADAAEGHAAAASLLLLQLQQADEAESLYRQALLADPTHLAANQQLAQLLVISGRQREAVPLILKRMSLGAFTVEELNMLDVGGGMRFETGLLEACRRARPEDPVVLLEEAAQSLRAGRLDDALDVAKQAFKIRSNLAAAHIIIGEVRLERVEAWDLAGWWLEHPLGSDGDPLAWMIRGRALDRSGLHDAAARCFWESLKIDPNQRAANYRLAQLLRDLGRDVEAAPFRLRVRQLQELKEINDLIVGAGGFSPIELVQRKVLLLKEMGRAWEALGWAGVAERIDSQAAWIAELKGQLEPLVGQVPPPPLTLKEANPAWQIDLAGLPDRWPGDEPDPGPPSAAGPQVSTTFRDDAKNAGLVMQYFNSGDDSVPGQLMYEFTGGGVAVIDFDRDGWPDLYFTQGARWPVDRTSTEHIDRLFRNRGDGRFQDVTVAAGLAESGFSQGATVGDFNSDGWPDLFVGNIGANRLYRNNGDGTFSDVSGEAGLVGTGWTTSSVLADITGDGVADLFVVNYLAGEDLFTRMCRHPDGRPRMCQPFHFAAAADRFYQGNGDGTFEDVTHSARVDGREGKGLGVVAADLHGLGRLSLFVANDTRTNFLYRHPPGTPIGSMLLAEHGLASGAGINGDGQTEGCMGVAVGDCDGDGLLDLFVTNFHGETNTLYLGLKGGRFVDRTRQAGLAAGSRDTLGFGTQFLDSDLDGDLDLVVTNGHVDDYTAEGRPFRMPPQFYRNRGDGRFDLLDPAVVGPHFSREYLGRGLTRLDYNRDGRPDVAISAIDVPVVLLTNTTQGCGHSLVLRLVGTRAHRDAIGTRVTVVVGGVTQVHQLTAGDGYHASNDRRLLIGLGESERVETLVVTWPSGRRQDFQDVLGDREYVVVEGHDKLAELPFDPSRATAP